MSILAQRRATAPPTACPLEQGAGLSVRWLPLLVCVLTLAVFSGVTACGFVRWDDDLHVYENPWLHPVTPAHLRHFWQTPYEGLYIPLSYTVFSLLAAVAHDPLTGLLDPHVFHTANLALHLGSVVVVFALLRRLVRNAWAAAAGTLLFAVHPVQVESVVWVSELRGLLSGLFSLLALWQFLTFSQAARHQGGRAWGRYALATVAFCLALLAKPSAVIVPLMAWCLSHVGRGDSRRELLAPLAGWGALALAEVALSRAAQPIPPEVCVPLWQRFFVAGDSLAFSLAHLVWPVRLGIDYGRTPALVLSHSWGYLTWLVPVCLVFGCWRVRRRWPLLLTAGALFVSGLLPVLGLVPFAFQQMSTAADRYLYLAMLGPALAVAAVLARVPQRFALRTAGLGTGVFLLLSLQCALQVVYWQDDLALFTRALTVNPQSWTAENDLGATLFEQGKTAGAITAFQEGLRWNPRQEKTWNNLGAALNVVGRRQEAVAALTHALRLAPGYAAAYNNLGLIAAEQGDLASAAADDRAAVRLDPNFAEAQNNLGVVLERQGQFRAAAAQFHRALTLEPGYASARQNLSRVQREVPTP